MDYNTYVSCIADAGYNPSSTGSGDTNDNGYYAIGFGTAIAAPADFPACRGDNTDKGVSWFAAGKSTGGATANDINFLTTGAGTSPVARDSFTAVAAGVIDSTKTENTTCDKWTMNHQKQLRNTRVGY